MAFKKSVVIESTATGEDNITPKRTDAEKALEASQLENIGSVGHVTEIYDGDKIQVLEGLEAVRQRPGMYIGGVDAKAMHHLFTEVSDNAVDEAMAGHCDKIDVILYEDGSLSVQDNGRGIPVDINSKYNMSGLELALTKLHAGGKFDSGAYKVSGGLHGVGVSCVNATSDWLEVTVRRDGKAHHIRFQRGVTVSPLKVVGKAKPTEQGTFVHWHPDPEIFGTHRYDAERIERRLRELAYLNKGLTLTFTNRRDPQEVDPDNDALTPPPTDEKTIPTKVFFHSRGILEYVEHLNETKDVIHKPIYIGGVREFTNGNQTDNAIVEIALQYNDGIQDTILAFTNNINNPDGGTQISGLKSALTRALNSYARRNGFIKEKETNLSGDDVREGLTAIVSIKLMHPQFNGQNKEKLITPDVDGVVNSIFGEKFSEFLEENSAIAKKIINKALIAQRARENARKAEEFIRSKGALDSHSLAGKLSDCSEKDPKVRELFLVEGKSAGGNAKQGRDRRTQAILPLRGKVLNVGKTRVDKVLENEEIRTLITALGTGITYGSNSDDEDTDTNGNGAEANGEESTSNGNGNGKDKKAYDLGRLRYSKIIIMTDADVDGDHIRTLLLTFFWYYMRPLVEKGYVYVAQPPLYRIRSGKNDVFYAKDETQRDEILKSLRGKKDVAISRFKGLGEMDAIDLAETTMDPSKRQLAKVNIDIENVPGTIEMFDILMSEKVEPRRDFIVAHAKDVTDVDWHG